MNTVGKIVVSRETVECMAFGCDRGKVGGDEEEEDGEGRREVHG